MFAPLHTQSAYSLGSGTARPAALAALAARYGFPALALTDVENIYGQVEFHHAARAQGIKPITGVELRGGHGSAELGRHTGRLVLLARDWEGYRAICRVITARRLVRQPTPEPLTSVTAALRGLFYLSDDAAVIAALLGIGVAPGDIRSLVAAPGVASAPAGVAEVAHIDAVMARAEDADLHRLLVAIRTHRRYDQVATEPQERSLPTAEQARELFAGRPDLLAESVRVAEACELDLTVRRRVFPAGVHQDGRSPEQQLHDLARARLAEGRSSGRWQGTGYDERLAGELETLCRLGFGSYLLLVAEITDEARRRGMTIGGRGSAGGSLVAHILGITTVDPLEHGLLFERFVNSERVDLPDIDLDVPSDRRGELIAWVLRRFGTGRTAMASTHVTYGLRAALRAGLSASGMRPAELDRVLAQIPESAETLDQRLTDSLTGRYREAVPLILRLVGLPDHLSVHPGGVVITDRDVSDYVALERTARGVIVTQYDMHSLAELGLIKVDLLGNRALSAIDEARAVAGVAEIPEHDDATADALEAGRTIGCFQVETPPVRAVLSQVPVRSVAALANVLAIVRPGPASGDAKAAFIRRAQGLEPAEPVIPGAPLAASLGLLLYEEDLMVAISAVTGWTMDRADALRARLIAGDDAGLEELRSLFVAAAGQRSVAAGAAEHAWRLLARFAAYSFNKAHAVSYAQIAWRSVWLRTHHPLAFAAAVLNHYGGAYPLRSIAADLARSGVAILGPHVNRSAAACVVEGDSVRLGLAVVKHLTVSHRERILVARPFTSLAGLLDAVRLSYREIQALVLSGACDALAPLSAGGYPFAHEELLRRLKYHPDYRPPPGTPVSGAATDPAMASYQRLVRIRNELEYLGMHPSGHPLAVLRPEAEAAGCLTIAEAIDRRGERVRVVGLVAAARRIWTRADQPMQFVTFEDETGLLEAVLLPGIYRALGDPVTTPGPFLVEGRMTVDPRDPQLEIGHLMPFHQRERPASSGVAGATR